MEGLEYSSSPLIRWRPWEESWVGWPRSLLMIFLTATPKIPSRWILRTLLDLRIQKKFPGMMGKDESGAGKLGKQQKMTNRFEVQPWKGRREEATLSLMATLGSIFQGMHRCFLVNPGYTLGSLRGGHLTFQQLFWKCMKFQKIRKRKTNIVYEHIYVEPRKTGQLSLFAGQEQRHRCREMWRPGGEGGVG